MKIVFTKAHTGRILFIFVIFSVAATFTADICIAQLGLKAVANLVPYMGILAGVVAAVLWRAFVFGSMLHALLASIPPALAALLLPIVTISFSAGGAGVDGVLFSLIAALFVLPLTVFITPPIVGLFVHLLIRIRKSTSL